MIGTGEGYEEVRRRLLERGYLDGRIERFVLREFSRPGEGKGAALRSGLRAAGVGGPILGGLLAATAVASNRPLATASDGVVLWIYFTVIAAAALLLLDWVAAACIAAIASRRGARRGDTLRGSLAVGVPILAYLLSLWWSRRLGGGFVADVAFLVAAVVCTMLVAWLAGLVSLARIIGRTGEVPDRGRPWVLAGVLAASTAAAGLVGLSGVRQGEEIGPAPFVAPPTGERLLFLGVDGLDAGLVEALEPRGAVERLLDAMTTGAVFPKRSATGVEPAEVWTTIATGMSSAAHGVRGAGVGRLPGVSTTFRRETGPAPIDAALRFLLPFRTEPTSAAERRALTLWEIIALERGSAAVGWWASWPADSGGGTRGYVVSDRVLPKLLGGAPADRDTSPGSLFERLAARFPRERASIRERFERAASAVGDEELKRMLWESYLIDQYHASTALDLREDPAVAAVFAYLPGLDILRHRLSAGVLEARDAAIALEAYVRSLDALLGDALALGPRWRAVLVADPGREPITGEGFVLMLGGVAEPGCVGEAMTDLDVAPLVLRLAGFPLSAEMPGEPPAGCGVPSLLEGSSEVATYGRRPASPGRPRSEYDGAMLERLRSLGYVR